MSGVKISKMIFLLFFCFALMFFSFDKKDAHAAVSCGDAHGVMFTFGTPNWDLWGDLSFCEGPIHVLYQQVL